jgi:hypothetical protein
LAVGAGVAGFCSSAAIGVQGESRSGRGVAGSSIFGPGVSGSSDNHAGVIGSAGNIGVYAENSTELTPTNTAYLGTRSAAGDFYGEVWVRGHLFKLGGGFEIDHPSDPANKYLRHSFVESSEMKNIYDGVAVLNSKGEAIVRLPTWFSELNKDFRYQLTCIGKYAPIYVSEQLRKNRFKISGGRSKLEVSWMITGVRKDAWANANRISVEVTKPKHERGYFLNPELHKVKQDKSIQRARYPEVFLSPDQRRKQLDLEKKLLAAQK